MASDGYAGLDVLLVSAHEIIGIACTFLVDLWNIWSAHMMYDFSE